MSPEEFVKEFGHLAETEDGLPRLRALVLQLGVSGRLGTARATDGEAATLSERSARGRSKRTTGTELSFSLPERWTDAPIEWAFEVLSSGDRKLKTSEVNEMGTFPVVDQGQQYIRGYTERRDLLLHVPECVVVFGDHTREVKYIDFDFVPGADGTKILKPLVHGRFLFTYIKSLDLAGRGYARHFSVLRSHRIAVPPLPEQKRIVEKVDQLMALCDELEAKQKQKRAKAVSFNQAALSAVVHAPNKSKLKSSWSRVQDHFEVLYELPENVKELRQTILQLAVMGKLSDTAEALLEKLSTVAPLQNGYAFKSEWFGDVGTRLVRNVNVSHGILDWTATARVSETVAMEFERFRLSAGDIVLSLDRPLITTGLKVAKVREEDLPALLLQRVGRFKVDESRLLSMYLLHWLNSPLFMDTIDPGRSNGVPHISSKEVEGMSILLPPLAEQHRIVAKVDRLMTRCDELESHLAQHRDQGRRLMRSVVESLVA